MEAKEAEEEGGTAFSGPLSVEGQFIELLNECMPSKKPVIFVEESHSVEFQLARRSTIEPMSIRILYFHAPCTTHHAPCALFQ